MCKDHIALSCLSGASEMEVAYDYSSGDGKEKNKKTKTKTNYNNKAQTYFGSIFTEYFIRVS